MPLYAIPLCDFKYAGDVYSETFKYDTRAQVSTLVKQKLLKDSDIKEIQKNTNKLIMQIKGTKIIKYNNKLMHIYNRNISKYIPKNLATNDRNMNKYVLKNLMINDRKINMYSNISLEDLRNTVINMKNVIEAENIANDEIAIVKDKELQEPNYREMNKTSTVQYLNRELLPLNLPTNSIYVNGSSKKEVEKHNTVKFTEIKRINLINKSSEKYFNADQIIETYLNTERFINRDDTRAVSKDNCKLTQRSTLSNIDIGDFVTRLKNDTAREMGRNNRKIIMHRLGASNIMDTLQTKLLYKHSKEFDVNSITYRLARIAINHMFKLTAKPLNRFTDKKIYIKQVIGLNREAFVKINKLYEKYLKDVTLIDIYCQSEKSILGSTVTNIFNSKNYALNKFSQGIYKEGNHNKFIEITKRWWWLNPTGATDSIIIPNKDFDYDSDLLNNKEFEYLRFINHPISWGSDFGLYEYPISIEIMIDLVNILLEIWHGNVQGWLCCTDKESMQFLMEILYDWYSLDTSKPSTDYYRAYRWIRWESEKVYFLNLDNGLQAIGVLIANLIDYLKQHHFNIAPIWRNPKVMDIERSFNRSPENGDLMRALDKNKGKRHYYIK